MKRPRHLRRRLLLAVLCLAFAEILARLVEGVVIGSSARTPDQAAFNQADMFVRVDDPDLSYRNRPGARVTVAGITYEHDPHGYRPLPVASLPGAPAVAFLGDSTTYGWGSVAEDTLPAQVARQLQGAIRPLDLGVSGYHTGQQVALYAAERHRLAGVELVVVVLYPNDFTRGVFEWDGRLRRLHVDRLPLPRALKPTLARSALYRVINNLHAQWQHRGEVFDPSHPDNWDLAVERLELLAALVREDGRQLLVAHLPTMEALDPYAWERPVRHVEQACARLGLPFVDLLEGFLAERETMAAEHEARTGTPVTADDRRNFLALYWVHQDDHHQNAAGNRLAARTLASEVARLLELEPGSER